MVVRQVVDAVVINSLFPKSIQINEKICLSVVGIFLTLFASFAQTTPKDSTEYKSRKLTFEEANLVSSYYRQDGDNAAVTGGIGSQKLSDISNTIDVKFTKWDKKTGNIALTWKLELIITHRLLQTK